MGKIVKKKMPWLYKQAPFLKEFVESKLPLMNNGYIAGGFLRRAVMEYKKDNKLDLARFISITTVNDVDFFYETPEDCTKAASLFFKASYGEDKDMDATPNSLTGFAYEYFPQQLISNFLYNANPKHQFIYRNTGTPEEVLNRFDIANCKIATNGVDVWVDDSWSKLEKDKQIKFDNFAGNHIIWRASKYLTEDYSLHEDSKHPLTVALMKEVHKPAFDVRHVRSVLEHKHSIDKDFVPMFVTKIGKVVVKEGTHEIAKIPDYSGSALDPSQEHMDAAVFIYRNRKEAEELEKLNG